MRQFFELAIKKITLGIAIMLFAISARFAYAEELDVNAKIVFPNTSQILQKIPELHFDSETLDTEYLANQPTHKIAAHLRGKFKSQNWTVLLNTSRIGTDEDGNFDISIPIRGKITPIELMGVNAFGEIVREKLVIYFNEWSGSFLANYEAQRQSRLFSKWRLSPSLGISSISYQQTELANFSQIALTAKFAAQTPITSKWDLGFNAFYTLLPITSNDPLATVKYLGVNARIGHVFSSSQSSWAFSLMGGVYYATMFVSTNDFGFQNIVGPQLFPGLRKKLKSGDSVFVYFKYSPIMNQLSVLDLNNREFAIGGSYTLPLKNGDSFSIMLDYSNIILMSPDSTSNSTSTTFSLGYSF